MIKTNFFKKVIYSVEKKLDKKFINRREEEGMQKDLIKDGLLTGSCPEKYGNGVDYHIFQGETSIYLKSKENVTHKEFGTLMCTINADRYRGKRLRLTAIIKTENVKERAGLWMGITGENAELLAMDNMKNRPIKHTENWKPHSIILDVEEKRG